MIVLRALLFVAGLLLLGMAAYSISSNAPAPVLIWLIIFGLIFTLGAIYEQIKYKPIEDTKPGGDWVETGERFIDNDTGETVTVYYQPKSGERRYVKKRN